jgi:hypothetical protein
MRVAVPRLGAVVLWCCGAVVLWCSGALVLWCSGALVLWCCGALVLWCSGALVLWCCGAVVLWCSGALVLLSRVLRFDRYLGRRLLANGCAIDATYLQMLETLMHSRGRRAAVAERL